MSKGSEFMDIRQLIGEATDYDKKVALEAKKPKSWCKSISAFAKCYGGKLVFGVANDDALVGLPDAEGDAEKISEIIKTHLNPIPEFKLSFEKDDQYFRSSSSIHSPCPISTLQSNPPAS